MTINVLAIGDLTNNIATLKKFVKKSKIHLINFRWSGPSEIMDEKEGVEFFDTDKISKIVKKINEIKNSFDLCVTMSSTGALVCYLADLNYILYLEGNDIRIPVFVKNAKDPLSTDNTVRHFNFLERGIYKNAYFNAVAWVASDDEVFSILKKYRKDAIRLSSYIMDTTIFNDKVKPVNRKKTKFTFFSPQRMELGKGYDLILKAIRLCKSDFEVIQVDWANVNTPKEADLAAEWHRNKPPQIKFVPVMKREEVAKYYAFADAIIGQMGGLQGFVEREAVLCKKPVVHYADPKLMYEINGKKNPSPFLPNSPDPKKIAETIDMVVESKEFREKLAHEEFKFVNELSAPENIASQWDNLFETYFKKYNHISKKSSFIKIKFRMMLFLIANRLYAKKLKRLQKGKYDRND